jgi:hypothetical protein
LPVLLIVETLSEDPAGIGEENPEAAEAATAREMLAIVAGSNSGGEFCQR